MSTLYQQTLNGASGSIDVGGNWLNNTQFSTSDIIFSGAGTAYQNGSGACVKVCTAVGTVGDVEQEIGLDLKTISVQPYAGLFCRGQNNAFEWFAAGINDANNYTLFGFDTAAGFADYIKKVVPDAYRPLYPVGQYTMKMEVRGTGTALYRVFINRREVLRWGSNRQDTGKCGLITGGPTTSSTGNHLTSYKASNDFDRDQIDFLGDSMTDGAFNNNVPALDNVGWYNQWPALVAAALQTADPSWVFEWANLGSSGKQASEMYADRNTASLFVNGISNLIGDSGTSTGYGWLLDRRVAAQNDILVIGSAGYNDILSNGQSASGVITVLGNMISAAKTAGKKVIILTLVHCLEGVHSAFTVPAGTNAKIDDVNTWILANSAGADAVVNLTVITQAMDPSNSTYRAPADGVHWLPPAMPFVATPVTAAVRAIRVGGIKHRGVIGTGVGGWILGA